MHIYIHKCSDPQLWYAPFVGTMQTVVRELRDEKIWLVREPSGYLNIVRFEDARPDFLRVQLESPYAAKDADTRALYDRYLSAALRDSLLRGEAPFASHAIYTRIGVLDDRIPEDRRLGISAGFAYLRRASLVVVYKNFGITKGMQRAIEVAKAEHIPVEYRTLEGSEWSQQQ